MIGRVHTDICRYTQVSGVDPGFSEGGGGGGGGANDSKGEWGVPPPTQSQEAFAIIVCN